MRTWNEKIFFFFSGEDNYYGIDYENCKKKIKDFVSSSHIDKPKDLHKQKIAAISFFFGHSRKAGLVGKLRFLNLNYNAVL